MAGEDSYRILLDEEWRLDDLSKFSHAYSQNYAFIYCLDSSLQPRDRARIARALEQYPWRGGYSYVNIYTVLQNQVPERDWPKIKSIRKSSPGWLDLFLNLDVALQVAQAVATLSAAGVAASIAYKTINKAIADINEVRKRNQLEHLRLTHAEAQIVTEMCIEMAKFLGFKNIKELHQYTGSPEVSLKLMLAHYRRISTLLEYVQEGKAALPPSQIEDHIGI